MDGKKFKEYVDSKEYMYSTKQGLLYAFKKLQLWEESTNVKVDNWTKELVLNLCKNGVDFEKVDFTNRKAADLIKLGSKIPTTSYHGLYTSLSYINKVLTFLGREDLTLSINEFNLKQKTKELFTREEIVDICDSLANSQDRFILYALFKGIRGNKYSDLVNLKVKDIDFDTKEIKLPSGRIVIMDEYLEDILKDVTDEEFGCYYYKLNRSGQYDVNSFYKFNMNSEYVLKVKPTVTNGDGMGAMSVPGLQTRFKGLATILNIQLTGVNVYRSGVLYEMNSIQQEWSQNEIYDFLKGNQYNLSAYETQLAYEALYGADKED